MVASFSDQFDRVGDELGFPWVPLVGKFRADNAAVLASGDAMAIVNLGVQQQRVLIGCKREGVAVGHGAAARFDPSVRHYYVVDHVGGDIRLRAWRDQWVPIASLPGAFPDDGLVHELGIGAENSVTGIALKVYFDGQVLDQWDDPDPIAGTWCGIMAFDPQSSTSIRSASLIDVIGAGDPIVTPGQTGGAAWGGTDPSGARAVITGPVASVDGTSPNHLVTMSQMGTIRGISKGVATTIGDGVSDKFTVTHSLGTFDVDVEVFETTPPRQSVFPVYTRPSVDTVEVDYAGYVPPVGSQRVLIFSIPGTPGSATGGGGTPSATDPVRLAFLSAGNVVAPASLSGMDWVALNPNETAARAAAQAAGKKALVKIRMDGHKAGDVNSVPVPSPGWPYSPTVVVDGWTVQDIRVQAWQDYFAQQIGVMSAGWDGVYMQNTYTSFGYPRPTGYATDNDLYAAMVTFLGRVTTAYTGRLEAGVGLLNTWAFGVVEDYLPHVDGVAIDFAHDADTAYIESMLDLVDAATVANRRSVIRMLDQNPDPVRNTFGLGLSLLVGSSLNAYRYEAAHATQTDLVTVPSAGTGALAPPGNAVAGTWARDADAFVATSLSASNVANVVWEYGGGPAWIEAPLLALPATTDERAGFSMSQSDVLRHYMCIVDKWGSIKIRRRYDADGSLNGTWDDYSTGGGAISVGQTLRFSVEGGKLTAYADSVQKLQVIDQLPLSGTTGGLLSVGSGVPVFGTAKYGSLLIARTTDGSGSIYTENWAGMRALGSPVGARSKTGTVWSRNFENGTLSVDLSTRTASTA